MDTPRQHPLPSMNVARSLRFLSFIGLALVAQVTVSDDFTSFRNSDWDLSDPSRHGSLQIAALQQQIEALEQAEHSYTPSLMPLLLDLGTLRFSRSATNSRREPSGGISISYIEMTECDRSIRARRLAG